MISGAWEVKAAVMHDLTTALQPGRHSDILSQRKKKKEKSLCLEQGDYQRLCTGPSGEKTRDTGGQGRASSCVSLWGVNGLSLLLSSSAFHMG